jgi:type I restriction enzyme S subunit
VDEIAEINPRFNWKKTTDDIEITFLPMRCVEELTGHIDLSFTRKLSEVKKGYTPFRDGDLLFAKITPCMENGKVAIVHGLKNGIGFGSTEFHVIRLHELLPREFFFFFLVREELRKDAQRDMTGSAGQLRVPVNYIRQIPICLPPLAEQHRIVTKVKELFTRLDAGVGALTNTKVQLKHYHQSVLKSACEGRLVPTESELARDEGREYESADVLIERIKEERKKNEKGKCKDLSSLDTLDLIALPEGWVWTSLGDITTFKNGINFNGTQKGNTGMLTIDVLNMYSNSIHVNLENLYRVDIQLKDDYLLKYGDILFVRSSVRREGVGWATLFKEIKEPVTFCGFIIRARLQNKEISPEYLTYYSRTNSAREKIISSSSQVTITNINQKSLGKIPIPIPPLAEQHRIVAEIERRLSVADEIEKTVDQSLKQSERLRQSILKRAFEGKLVSQDPNDELASVLLERIKAEKAKREAEKKTKNKRKRS